MGFDMQNIREDARGVVQPFFEAVIAGYPGVHSIHVSGSVLTADYVRGVSDINSVIFVDRVELAFLDAVATLGRKYGRKKVAPPLIMTPDYMQGSLDTFPMEFLNLRLIHQTVYGEDVLSGITVDRTHLRLQCEREIKGKLLWLRQGYLSSMGDRKALLGRIVRSVSGFVPLFRAIVFLMGGEPQVDAHSVALSLRSCCGLQSDVFERVIHIKRGLNKPPKDEVPRLFEACYLATEDIARIINDLKV